MIPGRVAGQGRPITADHPGEPKPAVLKDKDHPFYAKTSYTAKPGQKLYEATGESGQISVQSHAQVMTHAISWADPDYHGGPRAEHIRKGVVRYFFPDLASAQKRVGRLLKTYHWCTFVIVEAREYTGP